MFTFPLLAILALNAVLVLYVVREGPRSRTGPFLLINAAALILWVLGRIVADPVRGGGAGAWLPFVGASLVPANLLYFALVKPKPVHRSMANPLVSYALFLPPVVIVLFVDPIVLPQHLYGTEVRLTEFRASYELQGVVYYTALWLAAAFGAFCYRYWRPATPSERETSKLFIAAFAGLAVFALAFWIMTRRGGGGVMPAPSILAMLLAQATSLAVIRQEETERPLLFSRWIYYTVMALTGFFAGAILVALYETIATRPFFEPDPRTLTITVVVLTVLLVASLQRPQAWLDRVLFNRALEYRSLVLEARRDLNEAQERLRRAERLSMIGEVAARIAHEIKNPLGPIRGYTQMLRERLERDEHLPDRERLLSYLEVIHEEVDNIDRKVHHLLDLARRPAAIHEPIDANALLERTATLLRLDVAGDPAARRHVEVHTRLERGLPTLLADRSRIEEAVTNIARNALEACGREGAVELASRSRIHPDGRPGVLVTVADTGAGFSPRALERLFTPFYTEKPAGTGLGLSIAQSHVLEHHGTLEVGNRPGGGSEVRLWLPLAHGAEEPAVTLPNVKQGLEDARIGSSDRIPTGVLPAAATK